MCKHETPPQVEPTQQELLAAIDFLAGIVARHATGERDPRWWTKRAIRHGREFVTDFWAVAK